MREIREPKSKIRVAIVGVGNCASALVQGVDFYANSNGKDIPGIAFSSIGGYKPKDIEFVAAFDVDKRKVGKNLTKAIFEKPNCCFEFNRNFSRTFNDPVVQIGPLFDGVAPHMTEAHPDQGFQVDLTVANNPLLSYKTKEELISSFARNLREHNVDVLLNYLPVGSQLATEFWMEVCLEAKVAVVNCIPVFIASDQKWAKRFYDARVPIVGDDMRSQVGASIISATLQELFFKRGADIDMHYQDNIGGNTDFLNMQDQTRLASKKTSKENVIKKQNVIAGKPIEDDSIAAGPAEYFKALGDNKRAHWLIKARGFGGAPIEFTADLSVQDSPNSAGVVIDAIRFAVVAKELDLYGPLIGPSAFTQKTPPIDLPTQEAYNNCLRLADGVLPQFIYNPNINSKFIREDGWPIQSTI